MIAENHLTAESQPIVVTGTSRGVGRALALEVAKRGHRPVLLARPSAAQSETEAILREAGHRFWSFDCDLLDRGSVDAAASQVLKQAGAPLALIHNAARIDRAAVVESSDVLWDQQIELNLNAPFRLTRALLPALLEAKRGRVVFVSSISAVLGSKQQSAYHASKAGLLGLMRCLAEELSDTGVSTMAVLPGSIDTDMLKGSGFPPRMSASEVAQSLLYYALDAPSAQNGAAIEMYGV